MKINDCKYDKIKLLYKLSKIVHYIEVCAQKTAQKEGGKEYQDLLDTIHKTLEMYTEQLDKDICS